MTNSICSANVTKDPTIDVSASSQGYAWSGFSDPDGVAPVQLSAEEAAWRRVRRAVAHLLPQPARSPLGGRPTVDNYSVFLAIAYVIGTGCRWQDLPAAFPSAVTCWRRFRTWSDGGLWDRIWHIVDEELGHARLQDVEELTRELAASREAVRQSKIAEPRSRRTCSQPALVG